MRRLLFAHWAVRSGIFVRFLGEREGRGVGVNRKHRVSAPVLEMELELESKKVPRSKEATAGRADDITRGSARG